MVHKKKQAPPVVDPEIVKLKEDLNNIQERLKNVDDAIALTERLKEIDTLKTKIGELETKINTTAAV